MSTLSITIQPVLAAEPSGWLWLAWYVLLSASFAGLFLRFRNAVRFGHWSQVAMMAFFSSAVLDGTATDILRGYEMEAASISPNDSSWELALPHLVHDWATRVGLVCFALWMLCAWREYRRDHPASEANTTSGQQVARDSTAPSDPAAS